MPDWIKKFALEDDGASAVEYAVLIALIISVCIIVISAIGLQINDGFNQFASTFAELKQ
jgi:pilus assembly protein Flp/PilA